MNTKEKSLENWLFGLLAAGTTILCLVIILLNIFMYMQAVRRIYGKKAARCAATAIHTVSEDTMIALCTGKDNSEEAKALVKEVFLQTCNEDALMDMALFAFDPNSHTATFILCSNEVMMADKNASISFSDRQLNHISQGYTRIKSFRRTDVGWVNYAYEPVKAGNTVVGLIRVTVPIQETLEARIRFLIYYVPLCIILIFAFSTIISKTLKKRIVTPVSSLNNAAVTYSSRDAAALENETNNEPCFILPDYLKNDEIGRLWQTCADMEASLNRSIGDLKHLTAEKERQAAEVDVASKIQTGMLPKADPAALSLGRFTLSGSMNPAKGVGGDFYDYFMIDEDHLALVIGDVSGKGILAALFMILAMTHIRTRSAGKTDPAAILTSANDGICRMNPQNMFVTVWMGIVELSTGILKESNGGHDYPAVCPADGEFELKETENGIPLGIMEGTLYEEETRNLSHGERIFVYTDGVPEATNGDGEQFDFDRMLTALNGAPKGTDQELLCHMQDVISGFVGDAPQFDDLTMLSFTYQVKSIVVVFYYTRLIPCKSLSLFAFGAICSVIFAVLLTTTGTKTTFSSPYFSSATR